MIPETCNFTDESNYLFLFHNDQGHTNSLKRYVQTLYRQNAAKKLHHTKITHFVQGLNHHRKAVPCSASTADVSARLLIVSGWCWTLKKFRAFKLHEIFHRFTIYVPSQIKKAFYSWSKFYRYEVVNIDLKNKPEWYLEKNVLGKVPLLEEQGLHDGLSESLIIAEYLDDKFHDQNPLLPSDNPLERARQKVLIEVIHSQVNFCPFRLRASRRFRKEEWCCSLETDTAFPRSFRSTRRNCQKGRSLYYVHGTSILDEQHHASKTARGCR